MATLTITEKQSVRENLVEFLKVFLVIKPLQFIYKKRVEKTLNELKTFPKGTIGSELYVMLKNNNLKIIPKFENHDVKHIVLNYGMTSIEEIKMQAYLFGNGNNSIFCVLFLCSGVLFPEQWTDFYEEYKKGKKSTYIGNLSFNKVIKEKTLVLKNTYNQKN